MDENYKTSMEEVYKGADIAPRTATVILAVGQGRIEAEAIDKYFEQKKPKND